MRIPLASDVSVQAAGRGARTPHLPATPRSCCATLYRADRVCLICEFQTAPVGSKIGLARPTGVRIWKQYLTQRRFEALPLQVGSPALCSSFKYGIVHPVCTLQAQRDSRAAFKRSFQNSGSGVCSGILV